MKKCIKCGSPAASNNDNRCHYCGGQLVEVPTSTCSNCGAVIYPDTKFCQRCGTEADYSPDNSYITDREKRHRRDSIRREKDSDSRLLTIAVTITAIVCVIATISLSVILFLKSDDNHQVKTDTTKPEEANEITVAEEDTLPKSNSTTSGLRDYDSDNDDWYRLRKSKNDPSTQVGAYKTVEKALYYADIYCPQGYTLYDKDFNVIR